ncbi:MAG TPA: class I SAM-dependent methyltransferase, partial [Chloroflexia bacterium]|nr:class I SAM-dependent methyltransferase [Chloroflexia bacterium]
MALEQADLTVSTDPVGHETLRRMADVDHYNAWIARLIRPFVGRRVVEVGCGIGNMTGYFLDADLVCAFDLLPESAEWVGAKFAAQPQVHVQQGDICDAAFVATLVHHRFDTVVSINMLEHVADDQHALGQMYRLVEPGGHLLLFVPAGSYLFGSLDRALGHYRRYDRPHLAAQVQAAGFTLEHLYYVNLLGVAGWWLNSRVLRRHLLPKGQLRSFNALAPLLQALEQRRRPPFGQSLLCVAR